MSIITTIGFDNDYQEVENLSIAMMLTMSQKVSGFYVRENDKDFIAVELVNGTPVVTAWVKEGINQYMSEISKVVPLNE